MHVQQPLVRPGRAVKPHGVIDARHLQVAAVDGQARVHARGSEQVVVGRVGQQTAVQDLVVAGTRSTRPEPDLHVRFLRESRLRIGQ